MFTKVSKYLRNAWENITVEPIVALYCLIIALSGIAGEELYLKKACNVNLNYSMEVCDDLNEHEEVQIETQQFVSEIKSLSAVLQGVPGIIFVLLAGPMSDAYGRKALIIIPIFGYFILNLVYLLNSIWFQELKVEFLLFECLQDITGGDIVFLLATKCFIVDITSEEDRTTRMAVVDAFYGVGYLPGVLLGTYIKDQFGFVPLFSLTLGLSVFTLIYAAVFIKDSYHLISDEQRKAFDAKRDINQLKFDKGIFKSIFILTTSSFKTVFKKREDKGHLWIILMILVFSIPTITDVGFFMDGFFFYRLQYKMSSKVFSYLNSVYFTCGIVSQLFVIPFLSKTLKLSDTMIMVIALALACVGYFGQAFFYDVWVLFILQLFFLGYLNIYATTRSAMSKLLDPTEIGKAFSVLGLLESCLTLVATPIYGLIYQGTLDIFPGLWLLVSTGLLLIALIIAIFLHFGMKNSKQNVSKGEIDEQELETKTP